MEEVEIWKDVIGYEGLYQISSFGRIKSLYKETKMPQNRGIRKYPEIILKPSRNNKGYLYLNLTNSKRKGRFTVHRLVGIHFVPNPSNLPEAMHLDDNQLNNHASNIQWGTHQRNIELKVLHNRQGKGENIKQAKLTEIQVVEIRVSYNKKTLNQYKLAEKYGVTQSVIHDILKFKSWKHIKQI